MTRWSQQTVERAAPDAASLGAGRKLAVRGPWSGTGATETLLWGRCQGSGREPYQVSVDLTGPAYRCSCPSRKFPCKHAIALLLLWVRGDGSVADVAEGADFTRAWAQTRAGRAAEAVTVTAKTARVVDPVAKAKRLDERLALMDGGVDDFGRWLADLVRGGLAQARRRPFSWWDAAAARLVDAQLPALAERVRTVGSEINRTESSGGRWADLLLSEIGGWWVTVGAWQRRDQLDECARADLRTAVGWAVPTDEVRASDSVDDHWQVLGAHRSDDGRLQQQRTWLRGVGTGETVVVLDFAMRAAPLPAARIVSSVLDATLARYPGSAPRRALFASEPAIVSTAAALPVGVGIDDAQARLAATWADNAWAARIPVVLGALTLGPHEVRDAAGRALPLLPGADPWSLVALTGGGPADVFGELEAGGFRPLTIGLDEQGEVR